MVARAIVSLLIVIVTVAVLGSLSYPSVQVPTYSTATLSNTTTNAIAFASSTLVVAPYATSTVTSVTYPNQNGNFPGCDPASMACNYGFVTPYYSYYTQTYSQLQTSFYQVTVTMQSITTAQLTQTNYQTIPIYASIGLGISQFLILCIVVIVVVAALVMVVMKPVSRSHEDLQTETKHMCKKCGGEVGPSDGFCTKCGERIAG